MIDLPETVLRAMDDQKKKNVRLRDEVSDSLEQEINLREGSIVMASRVYAKLVLHSPKSVSPRNLQDKALGMGAYHFLLGAQGLPAEERGRLIGAIGMGLREYFSFIKLPYSIQD